MQLGALVPFHDNPGAIQIQCASTRRRWNPPVYDFLEAPDHVLGVNVASRPGWDADRNTSQDLIHDPFVVAELCVGRGAKALIPFHRCADHGATSDRSGRQAGCLFWTCCARGGSGLESVSVGTKSSSSA